MNSTRAKNFNGKKLFKINALLLPNYKDHLKAKKKYKGNGPQMNFRICEFLPLFGPPYHALILLANFEPRTCLTKAVILHPFAH
jgi:hypothetical protein